MKKELEEKKEERHLALYRKYRPETFEDVAGQDVAVKILENAIKENKISHAYLFSGSRGTGKTTMARIFARAIGSHADDIFELDAASNNSVDDIRAITEASQASTFGSRYKVYILDEAHMLSKAASNALLKTLEEPAPHTIFILATTDKHKLPATIHSRCQEIDFLSPTLETLKKRLEYIATKENVNVDGEALSLIAIQGKGSYRDAIGVLEKVINFNSHKTSDGSLKGKDALAYISEKNTQEVLGIIDKKEILKAIEAFAKKDILNLLQIIKSLNLNTKEKVEKFFVDFVKTFEFMLLLRIDSSVAKDILCDTTDISIINKEDLDYATGFSKSNPATISSINLLKLLDIESRLKESSLLKETVLMTSFINILEVNG